MKMMKMVSTHKQQAGITLMEVISSIVIGTIVVLGALALFSNASSSASSSQMLNDLTALRSSTQSVFYGQGGYGTASLNPTLITASKVPSTMTVSGATINTSLGGTLTVTGNTTNFTMALTNVPADVCTSLLSNSSTGWASVQVGSSAAITAFPVSPATATAAAQCGGTAPFAITWTSIN